MGNLYLVRHGQASFGADDYDQLSPKGREQGLRLGQYWREKAQSLGQHQASPFDAVLIGTLKRHRQTWEAMAEGAGQGADLDEAHGVVSARVRPRTTVIGGAWSSPLGPGVGTTGAAKAAR